jgi:hypothetical protein
MTETEHLIALGVLAQIRLSLAHLVGIREAAKLRGVSVSALIAGVLAGHFA